MFVAAQPPPAYLTECTSNAVVMCPKRPAGTAAAASTRSPPPFREPSPYWLELRVVGSGTNNTVGFWLMRRDGEAQKAREVLTMTDGLKWPPGAPSRSRVVDTRSCPGLRESVADVQSLIAAPPLEEPQVLATEQPYYVLSAERADRTDVIRRGSSASSIERWMLRTRERTRPCPEAPP